MKNYFRFYLTFFTSLLLTLTLSCQKELPKEIPTISTNIISNITSNSATSGGTISFDGGATITSRGVCWSLSKNPTISDSKTSDGSGTGNFSSNIYGLNQGTTYYVRAYATNIKGIAYGNNMILSTYGNVSDIDGNSYLTIKIGTQFWMAENLKSTKYLNGDKIETTSNANLDIRYEVNPKYQWAYNNDENNNSKYGRLYTGYAASDERGVCPLGWHVPTYEEWELLIQNLGGSDIAGMKMKETGTTPWNKFATNESGFTAKPGGTRHEIGEFLYLETYGHWWAYSVSSESSAPALYLNVVYARSTQYYRYRKNHAHSVRCVKDS